MERPMTGAAPAEATMTEVINVTNGTEAEMAANDWLLVQCKGHGVHYRQHGDAASACGDSWSRHTSARDFVTCKSCLALLRGATKAREESSQRTMTKAA